MHWLSKNHVRTLEQMEARILAAAKAAPRRGVLLCFYNSTETGGGGGNAMDKSVVENACSAYHIDALYVNVASADANLLDHFSINRTPVCVVTAYLPSNANANADADAATATKWSYIVHNLDEAILRGTCAWLHDKLIVADADANANARENALGNTCACTVG